MDQLTWMLGFLPNWFWNLTLILSTLILIAAWAFKFIPFISTYRLPLQVVSVIAALTSVWFLGASSNEAKWQEAVEKYKAQIKDYETRQPVINTEVVEKVVTQTKYVKGQIGVITETIEKWNTNEIIKEVPVERIQFVREYIQNCPIPKELLELHNSATMVKTDNKEDKK